MDTTIESFINNLVGLKKEFYIEDSVREHVLVDYFTYFI
jgi:hypothetical protein